MEHPHVVVLFGAMGDLARRKLLPGLLRLYEAGLLADCRIVGTSLEDIDTEAFVAHAHAACAEFGSGNLTEARWAPFAATLRYVPQAAGAGALSMTVQESEPEHGQNTAEHQSMTDAHGAPHHQCLTTGCT